MLASEMHKTEYPKNTAVNKKEKWGNEIRLN